MSFFLDDNRDRADDHWGIAALLLGAIGILFAKGLPWLRQQFNPVYDAAVANFPHCDTTGCKVSSPAPNTPVADAAGKLPPAAQALALTAGAGAGATDGKAPAVLPSIAAGGLRERG